MREPRGQVRRFLLVQTDTVTVYLDDTAAVLPMLDAGSVDSIVTDPPYGEKTRPPKTT